MEGRGLTRPFQQNADGSEIVIVRVVVYPGPVRHERDTAKTVGIKQKHKMALKKHNCD